ncbi:hypothetical protein [Oleidesulfovibrio alaskensis]
MDRHFVFHNGSDISEHDEVTMALEEALNADARLHYYLQNQFIYDWHDKISSILQFTRANVIVIVDPESDGEEVRIVFSGDISMTETAMRQMEFVYSMVMPCNPGAN